jgi:large subunit ribosomal protein L17
MRHRYGQRKLGRPTGHRIALIRNLMTDLLRYERLQTTEPKAAEVRREVEKLIGAARFHRGGSNVHAHRLASAKLYDEAVVKKLFTEILPRFEGRPGGFTRMVRLAPRRGDGAPMAQIELVQ